MTKRRAIIVREATLADLAKQLRLNYCVELGAGDRKKEASPSLLCDLFEAIIGAVYCEGGLDQVNRTFGAMLDATIDRYDSVQNVRAYLDPKGFILMRYQAGDIGKPRFWPGSPAGTVPQLVVLEIEGASHCYQATAQSRKLAEAQVASAAIAHLNL